MTSTELLRGFYEAVVSRHLLWELPAFITEDCVLRRGRQVLPLGPAGMAEHLRALRETHPDDTVRILRQ